MSTSALSVLWAVADLDREKILSLLSLPPSTLCEYRSNRALLDAASNMNKMDAPAGGAQNVDGGGSGGHHSHGGHSHHTHGLGGGHHHQSQGFGQHTRHQHGQHAGQHQHHSENSSGRGFIREPRGPRDDATRTGGWGNGFRREQPL